MGDVPETLTPEQEQEQTLQKFRERVQDVLKLHHDDDFLFRWLRARHFDITKAEKMLRESMAFREKRGADTILEGDSHYKPPEVLENYLPGSHFGFDMEGHPTIIAICAQLDFEGIMRCVSQEDLMKFVIYKLELFTQEGRENGQKIGKRIDQITIICDMDGFTWSSLTLGVFNFLREVMPMVEANYPEIAYHIFVVNAPSIFNFIYPICKPLLAEETLKTIKYLDSNWKDELKKYIDADNLPVHWGGDCTDPDGDTCCISKIVIPKEVPKSYYRAEKIRFDPEKSKTVTVGAGTSHTVEIPINKRGTAIKWRFKTVLSDIKVSMFLQGDSGDREIIPPTSVDSHIIPEDRNALCEEEGTYVLKFDNSYSWMNSKELTYQIDIDETLVPEFSKVPAGVQVNLRM